MRSRTYAGFFTAAALALGLLLAPKIAAAAAHLNYDPYATPYVGGAFSCPAGFSIGTVARTSNLPPAGAVLLGGTVNGGGIDANPITLTIPAGPDESVDITVTDCCFGGDAYQVIVDGVLVGTTPLVTITGIEPPTPPFTVNVTLAAGAHTIDIHDATFSFIGFDPVPPFPAGSLNPVPLDYSPAGLTVAATCLGTIADPGCSLTDDELDTVIALLPPEFDYIIIESRGPSTSVDSPGICATGTIVTECDPDLAAGTAGACSTGADAFQGFDTIGIATTGSGTCDTVCKTLGGIRRCFLLCFDF